MRQQHYSYPYTNRRTSTPPVHAKKKLRQTLKAQIAISVCLFLLCTVAFSVQTPMCEKIKQAVILIITHDTDLKAEGQKLKERFVKEETLSTLAPVSAMVPPSSGAVLKGFGMQDSTADQFHYGVVVSAKETENIVAVSNGVVSEIATNAEYGSYLLLQHSDEITTLYGGLGEILPNIGDAVEKGQPLARAGGENNSFYFELRRNDTYLDPTQFITFEKASHD